jgi:hypothetical protein
MLLRAWWLFGMGAALSAIALIAWLWPRREMAQVAGGAP